MLIFYSILKGIILKINYSFCCSSQI